MSEPTEHPTAKDMREWSERLMAALETVGKDREHYEQMLEASDQQNALLKTYLVASQKALREISLCSQNSASSKEECGRIARAVILDDATARAIS